MILRGGKKKDDVVRLLEKHNEKKQNRRENVERKQAMKKPLQQKLLNSNFAGSGAEYLMTDDPHENCPPSDDAEIVQDRIMLLDVMNSPSAKPVELSLEYIQRCIKKDHKLGSGAYGDVFLAEDSHLPKKFAVKLIRPTHCDQGTIENIRKSFQRELSVRSLSTDIFTHWEESPLSRQR